jgi:hypothetical protein
VPYLDRWLADALVRASGFAATAAVDPVGADTALRSSTSRVPVVPIVPALDVRPLDITPTADLRDPSGALVLIGAAAVGLMWRRHRGRRRLHLATLRAPTTPIAHRFGGTVR